MPTASSHPDLLAVAAELARRGGILAAPADIQQLPGGRNNRVFQISFADGSAAILKNYFADKRDPRDRLGAEWSFLTHLWSRHVRSIPRPIAMDRGSLNALLSLIPGRSLQEGEVSQAHVDAAAEFVIRANSSPRAAEDFPAASEACFSLAEHLATVERRLRALDDIDPAAPLADEAASFVRGALAPAWSEVKARTLRSAAALRWPVDAALDREAIIVSPSDFGFHNAITGNDGSLTFIDFEYAGQDDPAKLACDFLCQPRVPVPPACRTDFMARLAQGLGQSSLVERSSILLDVYRIKWICIILNEFLPLGATRRAFAESARSEAQCAGQLRSAKAKLAEIAQA